MTCALFHRPQASWLPAAIVSAVVGSLLLVGALAVAVYKRCVQAHLPQTRLAQTHPTLRKPDRRHTRPASPRTLCALRYSTLRALVDSSTRADIACLCSLAV